MDIPELVVDLEEVDETKLSVKEKRRPANSAPKVDDSVSTSGELEPQKKIPITIITGYLGSGKSTLLDIIGKVSKKKLAIILNEFGDSAAIEKSVTINDTEKNESIQEWLDLGNGCLCCTVKDNGVTAIEQLVEKSKDKIDYILLETTGIADPAPIAKMFWLDEGLSSSVYIDGVVTVVDAGNIIKCLNDVGGHWHRENNHTKMAQAAADDDISNDVEQETKNLSEGITTAHLQIALADVVLLNKIDRIEGDEARKEEILDKLKAINSTAPIHCTSYGNVDLEKVLDLNAFDADAEKMINSISYATDSSFHDDKVKTVVLDFPPFTSDEHFFQFERLLQYLLWEKDSEGEGTDIHRLKGLVMNESGSIVKVVQGVRETYEIVEGGRLTEDIKSNKLVLIGKNIDKDSLVSDMTRFITS